VGGGNVDSGQVGEGGCGASSSAFILSWGAGRNQRAFVRLPDDDNEAAEEGDDGAIEARLEQRPASCQNELKIVV
jgi:hypothetical protein